MKDVPTVHLRTARGYLCNRASGMIVHSTSDKAAVTCGLCLGIMRAVSVRPEVRKQRQR